MAETHASEIPFSSQRHVIELEVDAAALGRQRKEGTVRLVAPSGTTFRISCDEGAYLGGEDTAPPPLAYLSAAAAF